LEVNQAAMFADGVAIASTPTQGGEMSSCSSSSRDPFLGESGLSVEVLGAADATLVANELRRLDVHRFLRVIVGPAPLPSPSAVALCVAAPTMSADLNGAELARYADVVLVDSESLADQAARLWSERLSVFTRAMGGEPGRSAPAVLHAFDQRWAAAAGRRLRRLQAAFASIDAVQGAVFDHIGSTSVTGLSAKPILDLQVRVPRLRYDEDFDAALFSAGYRPALGSRPDSPGVYRDIPRGSDRVPKEVWDKRLFVSPDPAEPAILHVRLTASPWGRYTVQFRDWLRAHPAERNRYENVKRQLARAHESDRDYDYYTRAKTDYFDQVQSAFESWSRDGQ